MIIPTMVHYEPVTQLIREAAIEHYKLVMTRLKNPHKPELQERTIDEMRRGVWDNDPTTQLLAKLYSRSYKPKEEEVDPDVIVVRTILHAHQRAMSNDSGWGNMSYLKGSYDHLPTFKAALAAYKELKKEQGNE